MEETESARSRFESLSQSTRRELEHFDFVMRSEFGEAFEAYREAYWRSLRKGKADRVVQ